MAVTHFSIYDINPIPTLFPTWEALEKVERKEKKREEREKERERERLSPLPPSFRHPRFKSIYYLSRKIKVLLVVKKV